MFTFVKIQTSLGNQCVMLRISDSKELLEYIRFFAGRAWQGAKVCVNRITQLGEISHLGEDPEAIMLKFIAQEDAKKDGSFTFNPLKHTAKLIDLKWTGMARVLLAEKEPLVVSPNGGYCQLSSFLSTHEATIVEEIASEELVFPTTFDPSKAHKFKTVVLENDNELDDKLHKFSGSDYKLLNKLKMRNKEEIMFYLTHCKEIIAKTTLLNEDQVIKFLKIFSTLQGKTIMIISDTIDIYIEKLRKQETMRPILDKVFSSNNVIFYNSSLKITNTNFL